MHVRSVALLVSFVLVGCGSARPSGVATNPPFAGGSPGVGGPSASASGPQTSGTRTVLVSLGLNIHTSPAVSAKVVATAPRGDELTVIGFNPDNGGWYQVKGQTATGWVTADPNFTASGSLANFHSDDKHFSALYRSDWTFSDSPAATVFRPKDGATTIVVRVAATPVQLGPAGLPGYKQDSTDAFVACGYTGDLTTYSGGGASPQPTTDSSGSHVTRLADFAQIRLTLDSTHVIDIESNYAQASDLQYFRDFVNAITYPFQLCQQVAPPTAAPTGPVSPQPSAT